MKTKSLKLAEQMLKATTSYKLNQIDYLIDLVSNHINVWSTVKGNDNCFHSTEIISMFHKVGYSTYIQYKNGRCELTIF